VSASRMKLPIIVATIVGAALALLSWSQTWFELRLADVAAQGSDDAIAVPGSVASPALAALGLAGLALVAALAIAGPGIRIILGVLEVVLGGCVLLAAGVSLGSPVAAVAPAVTDATGVSGSGPTAELVADVTATAWPAIAVAGGVLLVLAGIAVLVTGTRWPSSSRRYRAARLEESDEPAEAGTDGRAASDRAIDDWDDLSRGDDPTGDPATEPADTTDDAGVPPMEEPADRPAADPPETADGPTRGESPAGPNR
jgi:uncharacterized membrane protein (TIGR02234 family)